LIFIVLIGASRGGERDVQVGDQDLCVPIDLTPNLVRDGVRVRG
jgi:hypothetical protein